MTLNTPTLDTKKVRRIFRRKKKQVIALSEQADQQIDQLLFRRLTRLANIRRFLTAWIGLLVIITFGVALQIRAVGSYYLKDAAVEGGTYKEGIIGSFTNANPLYASGQVDSAVSKLIFSSLFTYNERNELVGDLADSYVVNPKNDVYTVTLRQGIKWHDGTPFTSEDVLFTYHTIQNADAKSPLFSSWQGVKVSTPDPLTVVFELPSAFSPFIYSLTNGIVPKHKLQDKPVASLRSENFNTIEAIGTGPFKMSSINVTGTKPEEREEQVALVRYDEYHRGKAKLESVMIKSFHDEESLVKAFKARELNASATLSSALDEGADQSVKTYNIPLTSIVMLFFNTASESLNDTKTRLALLKATDIEMIKSAIPYDLKPANAPLLIGQLGYDAERVQHGMNVEESKKLLDEAGWILNENGIRYKNEKALSIRLVAQNLAEYSIVSQLVQAQWEDLGVQVEVTLKTDEDIQSGALADHSQYDVLLHGIAIGKDPDVFAYWHSTQVDVRSQKLNFSEYKNKVADEALESGRTRIDPAIRAVKYRAFLEAWRDEAPAVALYQPRYKFVVRGTFEGFEYSEYNSAVDRYATITNWMIRQDKVVKTTEDL